MASSSRTATRAVRMMLVACLALAAGCRSGLGVCERDWKSLLASANATEEEDRVLAVVECTQDNDVRLTVWFTERATGAMVSLDTDRYVDRPITAHIEITNFWNRTTTYQWQPISTNNAFKLLLE